MANEIQIKAGAIHRMSDENEKPAGESRETTVPKAVVARLSLYLRELQHLMAEGRKTTNSSQLGERLGLTDVQVRKDLTFFGQFGYPGIGYRCGELVDQIRRILGTGDEPWPVALVGVGNLGHALLRYRGFGRRGFRIVAAFDADPQKIGQRIESVEILSLERLAECVRQREIRLALLAVPASAAQDVAAQLAGAGIAGILSFAPVTVKLSGPVAVTEVDLAIELEQLAFAVVHRTGNP